MTATYAEFLAGKARIVNDAGFAVDPDDIHPSMFDFQRDLIRWSCRKGRAGLFATTGFGKSRMQIEWAAPVWKDIRETDVLSARGARENDDEKHLCPLQLPVIERCVKLWSNPGETVLSPFAGIGSEGYEALMCRRRFVGIELKPAYWRVAVRNLRAAERKRDEGTLFKGDGDGA